MGVADVILEGVEPHPDQVVGGGQAEWIIAEQGGAILHLDAAVEFVDDGIFALEIVVDGTGTDPSAAHDESHGGAVKAPFRDQIERCL